jgi:hypothetical protein
MKKTILVVDDSQFIKNLIEKSVSKSAAEAKPQPFNELLCGIEQAKTDYNDDMDRLEKTYDLKIKPISERERERLINKSCGD